MQHLYCITWQKINNNITKIFHLFPQLMLHRYFEQRYETQTFYFHIDNAQIEEFKITILSNKETDSIRQILDQNSTLSGSSTIGHTGSTQCDSASTNSSISQWGNLERNHHLPPNPQWTMEMFPLQSTNGKERHRFSKQILPTACIISGQNENNNGTWG